MGQELSLLWALPFAGILLSIALCPLFAPHFWHHHFSKISLAWALSFAVPFYFVYHNQAVFEIVHIYVVDYIPFIILLFSLFTISGGILVRGSMAGSPIVNALLILIGTAFASLIGTTGASMLLIRPVLRANEKRKYKVHTIIFFIFLVSNIGGSLTPLGDPPLFLGFLHGVPFFWTLEYMIVPMVTATAVILGLYFVIDLFYYTKESPEAKTFTGEREPIRILGVRNFVLLLGVIGGVLLSGYWKDTDHISGKFGPFDIHQGKLFVMAEPGGHAAGHGEAEDGAHGAEGEAGEPGEHAHHEHDHDAENAEAHGHDLEVPIENIARDLILLVMAFVSLAITPKGVRAENGFTWFPIKEVAILFAGIFMTIVPALKILQAGSKGELGPLVESVTDPARYFWVTGILSSFLDNAPTYLTFFNSALGSLPDANGIPLAQGRSEAEAVRLLISDYNQYLLAIAVGAVFMGANTYIGNAPNFMVKSIAEEADIPMPSFLGYMFKFSIPILIPTFVLVTWIFFWK